MISGNSKKAYNSLRQSNQTHIQEVESLPVLRETVAEAVHGLKAGKSPGVDNIPSELRKNGGEAIITVLTAICQKIWETKELPKEWTQSLVIPLPKESNLKQHYQLDQTSQQEYAPRYPQPTQGRG